MTASARYGRYEPKPRTSRIAIHIAMGTALQCPLWPSMRRTAAWGGHMKSHSSKWNH